MPAKPGNNRSKNIIIVANNLGSSARTSKCGLIGKHDIIVRFNVGWGVISKNDRVHYVFFRKQRQSYIGFDSEMLLKNPQLYRKGVKYVFLNSSGKEPLDKIFENYPLIAHNHEIMSTNPTSREYNGIKPSSGLVAIKYFMTKFPKYRIKLFNFSWEGWAGHNFTLEQQMCLDWAKAGIIDIIPSECGIQKPLKIKNTKANADGASADKANADKANADKASVNGVTEATADGEVASDKTAVDKNNATDEMETINNGVNGIDGAKKDSKYKNKDKDKGNSNRAGDEADCKKKKSSISHDSSKNDKYAVTYRYPYMINETTLEYPGNNIYARYKPIRVGHGKSVYRSSSRFKSSHKRSV